MVQNVFDNPTSEDEKSATGMMKGVYKMLAKDGAAAHYVSPNLMSDELAQKVPRVVVLTTEFDMYRRCAENARDLYERNGTLLEYGCVKGVYHGAYFIYSQKRTDEWFRSFAKICKLYL